MIPFVKKDIDFYAKERVRDKTIVVPFLIIMIFGTYLILIKLKIEDKMKPNKIRKISYVLYNWKYTNCLF